MKTVIVTLVSFTMLATASFAAVNDPSAEARFKMKNGRYTPAEEARRQSIAQKAGDMDCTGHRCCPKGQAVKAAMTFGEQWLQAKSGRSTVAHDTRQVAVTNRDQNSAPSSSNRWLDAKLGRSTVAPAAPELNAGTRSQCFPGCCE